MIRWHRSKNHVTRSHCGAWVIDALYDGRAAPYIFEIRGPNGLPGTAHTLTEAKLRAAVMARRNEEGN